MRHEKRQLISEGFLLETAIVNRENRMLETLLLGTTSRASCAVQLNVVCPFAVLYTRLVNDPFEFNTPNMWYEELCKRRLFRSLLSCEQ